LNFRLAARRLSFEAAAPWGLLAKNPSDTSTLALLGARKAGPANFKNPEHLQAPSALDVKWWWRWALIRNYFEQSCASFSIEDSGAKNPRQKGI